MVVFTFPIFHSARNLLRNEGRCLIHETLKAMSRGDLFEDQLPAARLNPGQCKVRGIEARRHGQVHHGVHAFLGVGRHGYDVLVALDIDRNHFPD